jgi:hypothetical protein
VLDALAFGAQARGDGVKFGVTDVIGVGEAQAVLGAVGKVLDEGDDLADGSVETGQVLAQVWVPGRSGTSASHASPSPVTTTWYVRSVRTWSLDIDPPPVPLRLREAFARRGRAQQPPVRWNRRSWQEFLPAHAELFARLSNPIDRAAVSAEAERLDDASDAVRVYVAAMFYCSTKAATPALVLDRLVQSWNAVSRYSLGDESALHGESRLPDRHSGVLRRPIDLA